MQRTLKKVLCTTLALAWAGHTSAQSSEEEELALAYGDKSFVTIATGSRLPVSHAPSVATVITAEDIQAIGATDIDDVLETVPGLHVARGTQANMPVYVIRGIHRDTNPQVLMLINGIPITSVFSGNRGNVWGGLPLENVARIEVIRGPGSAIYGADAFAGVINITTKTAADINGTQVGLRGGSFKTGDAWLLHGGKLGPIDVAGYLRFGSTEGARQRISADAQTGWDNKFGTHASHAPGPMNNGRDAVDGSLDLAYGQWRFRTGYQERDNVGSGSGIASALDPTGKNYSQRFTSDVTWRDMNFGNDWDVSLQASFMHYKEFSDLTLFPAGTQLSSGTFADGMIGNPYKWERHGRLDASAFYNGFERHRVRLGTGYSNDEIYRTRESRNYDANFAPLGAVTDVSDTMPFLRPHGRQVRYQYVQDEWNFAKDWTLTTGVRRDQYSDVGGTTNPRLALVWEAAYNLTSRVMYGSAFRAPSFTELYNINNPVAIGNNELHPERIRTLEAAVAWQPMARLNVGANIFRYQMSDIIRLVNFTFQNSGEQKGTGLELEMAWEATKELRLSGNYGYQRSEDKTAEQSAGNAPHHHTYVRADWRFVPTWLLNTQVNWVGERPRVSGDTRPALSGYRTVDLTLRTMRGTQGWNFAMSVRNLFNADAREPSPFDQGASQPFISIPNDFPLPGRSFHLQASYSL